MISSPDKNGVIESKRIRARARGGEDDGGSSAFLLLLLRLNACLGYRGGNIYMTEVIPVLKRSVLALN